MNFGVSYDLTSLLNTSLRFFKIGKLYSIKVILFDHLIFNFNYTDSITNKYRYSHSNGREDRVMRFYDSDFITSGIKDFYDDIKFEIRDMNLTDTFISQNILIKLKQINPENILVYKSEIGGFNYNLVPKELRLNY